MRSDAVAQWRENPVESELWVRFWVVAGATAVGLGAATFMVAIELGRGDAMRWALGASLIAGFVLAVFGYLLPRNHPSGMPSTRYRSIGVANSVTLFRGGLLAGLAGFLLVRPADRLLWVPAVCYALAIGLDWVDGRLARAHARTTVLGTRLDMALDTTGLLVATLVGVLWGRIPVWFIAAPAARYCYRASVGLRERRGLPVEQLPESVVRRPIAGLQMVFLAVALVPVVPIGLVRVLAVVVLVLVLGIFIRDYLAVTHRLS